MNVNGAIDVHLLSSRVGFDFKVLSPFLSPLMTKKGNCSPLGDMLLRCLPRRLPSGVSKSTPPVVPRWRLASHYLRGRGALAVTKKKRGMEKGAEGGFLGSHWTESLIWKSLRLRPSNI